MKSQGSQASWWREKLILECLSPGLRWPRDPFISVRAPDTADLPSATCNVLVPDATVASASESGLQLGHCLSRSAWGWQEGEAADLDGLGLQACPSSHTPCDLHKPCLSLCSCVLNDTCEALPWTYTSRNSHSHPPFKGLITSERPCN